ncbi:MAG: pantoate--beta-alanine ligase [Candidatus Omnitrophica bacterium]|nr:pantoate--beta-alanine ligase [Candidatus Omnitrophota bacterium]
MRIIKSPAKMHEICRSFSAKGKTIGFVPTMGYLHQGHVSLLEKARKENDIVILSIYVNPTQFGPKEDLKKYPRDIGNDKKLAKRSKTDIIFIPSDKDMYPQGYGTFVDVGSVTNNLCGISRPGHFKGVATIVTKLFNIVIPNIAYFGQKDVQQCAVIKKLVSELNMFVKIKVLPIKRENDGLAISSRNVYLSEKEREDSRILCSALYYAKKSVKHGQRSSDKIIAKAKKMILSKRSAKIDYVKIVSQDTMKDIDKVEKKAVMAIAVFIGKTRLIDNIVLG